MGCDLGLAEDMARKSHGLGAGASTRFPWAGFTHAENELQQGHVVAIPAEERKEREEKEK